MVANRDRVTAVALVLVMRACLVIGLGLWGAASAGFLG